MRDRIRYLAAGLVGLLSMSLAGRAEDWPGFRGARVDGVAAALAVDRAAVHLEVVWKRPIGSGYSGIAVVGDRLVTMYDAEGSSYLAALAVADGAELWRLEVEPRYEGHDGSHDGPISTPLVDARRVFALGPRGRLVAADLESGELLWATYLVEDLGVAKPFYGFATSPLVVSGVLLVELGADPEGLVAGFDPDSGELLWTAGEDSVGYQSPVPLELDGGSEVLVAGSHRLIGLDPTDGSVVWEIEHQGSGGPGAESIVPIPLGGRRIFVASKDRSSTVWALESVDGVTVGVPVWESGSIRNSYTVPVHLDGHLYAFSSRFLTCVDAATGEPRWKSRQPGDGFHTAAGRHLVIVTKAGGLHLAEASPEAYRELASLDLFEDLAWTAPSVAGGEIYTRSLGEVARVAVRSGAAPAPLRADSLPGPIERLADELRGADDPAAVVDAFIAAVPRFPIVEGEEVTFVFRGEAEDVSIAGDMVGARLEEPMHRLEGTDLFYWTTRLEPGSAISYSFVKDFEQQLDPLNPATTSDSLFAAEFEPAIGTSSIEMSELVLPGWKEPVHLGEAPEDERGSLVGHVFEVEDLGGEVTVQLYLPAGYPETGDQRYPAIYVHGGSQAIERGRMVETLDNLVGDIEPTIAVFVDARYSPRSPQGYVTWLVETLVPFVDATYRTDASRERRAGFGVSFHGYVAYMAAFAHPEVFGGAAGISPHMNDIMRRPLREMATDGRQLDLVLYLDWGTYDIRFPEEALDLVEMFRGWRDLLAEQGYETAGGEVPRGAGWRWWRAATGDALRTLFPRQ